MYRSRAARIGALAALAMLVTAACGDSGKPQTSERTNPTAPPLSPPPSATATDSTEAPTTTTTIEAVRTIEVVFASGQVVGGARRETVRLGEKVRLRVTSDIADEVHVHTYDVSTALTPGRPAELNFTATIPGVHEVEFEKKRKQVLTLEVR